MARDSPWPRFIALLPFRRRQDPAAALAILADAALTADTVKYRFGPISPTHGASAKTWVQLKYRASQETELTRRRADWKNDAATGKVLDYLFGTRFVVSLNRWGRLEILFPEVHWAAADEEFLRVELSNHLFHLAKFAVVKLQTDDLIPSDFEYKRYATRLASDPDVELIEVFEEVFAQGHHRMMEFAVESFAKTRNSLGALPPKYRTSWFGQRWYSVARFMQRFVATPFWRLVFPLRFRLTRRLRWSPIRTQAKAFKSQVGWYYALVWHGLEKHRKNVEEVLAQRAAATAEDMQEISQQLEWLVGRRDSVISKRDTLLGIIGVGLSIVFAGIQFAWPALFFWLFGGAAVALLFFVSVEQIHETNELADEAESLCTVFRWEAPQGRGPARSQAIRAALEG